MNSVTYHAATRSMDSPPLTTVDYLCRAIRLNRERLNLSQFQLGALIGVSGFSVGAWERGESMPTSEEIDRMATHFAATGLALRFSQPSRSRGTVLASASSLQEVR
jgi:transcriptional regulator with XRE-family HTH domain